MTEPQNGEEDNHSPTGQDKRPTTDTTAQKGRRWTTRHALLLAIILVILGGLIANTAQTAGGKIRVVKVNYPTESGLVESGLLYIPPNATAKTPACGIVAIHGYINSHDTMDGVAIEMARRGCVVLAADQTGHDTSQGPAFADAYGGPASLAFLDSLQIVKSGDVGLVGHSMGGWASVLAAGLDPKGSYRSLILLSSSTSTPGLEPIPGTPVFPRNTEVIEAKYSEFSQLMWTVPKGSQIPQSPRLMALFGTKSPVVPGKLYGSLSAGTGRELYLQSTTHPGITFDPAVITHVVNWEQATLTGVGPLAATNQVWLWDEAGTFLALIGVALFLFGAAGELLRLDYFASLIRIQPPNRAMTGLPWWIGAFILAALGPVTFFVFQTWGENTFKAGPFFPENIPTGIIVWAIGDILIGLVLFLIWHFTTSKEKRGDLHSYGITEPNNRIEWTMVGRTVVFGLATVALTYVPVYFFSWAFTSDVRLWIFNIKPVDYTHAKIALDYVWFFAIYFIGLSVIVFGQLRPRMRSLAGFLAATTGLLVVGFAVFIALEYGVLLSTGELLTSSQPLLAIVAFQFIPIYLLIGTILGYFFYKTGRIYSGVVIASLFITAIVVAGTATQGVVW